MQEKGLEPSGYCYHTDLNRARLPIPPFLRTFRSITGFLLVVNKSLRNNSRVWGTTHEFEEQLTSLRNNSQIFKF